MIPVATEFERTLNPQIDAALLADDKVRSQEHEAGRRWPKDRLSAGKLWQPLQWQALKALGCPARPIEPYARRLFLRGRQCEDWLVEQLKRVHTVTEQVPIEYRECVGYVDVLLGTLSAATVPDGTRGAIPWEIKSVANMKYKRIEKQGPDRGHLLQACLYALAIGAPEFGVIYVAADDFRVRPYLVPTAQIQPQVDEVITKFKDWQPRGTVPEFEPIENWHSNPRYSPYPEWAGLDEQERTIKLALERLSWQTTSIPA